MSARDPRLRPYRAALWIAYFAVILAGVGLMAVSVARSLRSPPRPARSSDPLPTRAALRVCLADLELLAREQNQRAWAFGTELEAPDPFASWNAWAREWELRLDDLSDRCRLDASTRGDEGAARAELAAARDALLALHRAYAAQVNRFAQEHGDLGRAAAEAFAHAREAVTRSR